MAQVSPSAPPPTTMGSTYKQFMEGIMAEQEAIAMKAEEEKKATEAVAAAEKAEEEKQKHFQEIEDLKQKHFQESPVKETKILQLEAEKLAFKAAAEKAEEEMPAARKAKYWARKYPRWTKAPKVPRINNVDNGINGIHVIIIDNHTDDIEVNIIDKHTVIIPKVPHYHMFGFPPTAAPLATKTRHFYDQVLNIPVW